MYKLSKLKNGLTLITVDMPHLDSVTSYIAIGTGARYENAKNNGIAHFLEHMFFKGTKKYPTHEDIAKLVDGMGAVNNAGTANEFTIYWIKSSAEKLVQAIDILSSMMKESLFSEEEIEREKGVIIEEMRRSKDDPSDYVWRLYHKLHFGSHPLSIDVIGTEETIKGMKRKDFLDFVNTHYITNNMALVFAGKLPKNINQLAESYFADLKKGDKKVNSKVPFKKQTKSKVDIFYKKTDQASLVLGVPGFSMFDNKKYAARVMGAILGEGMSSRLFIQVRERRGLAYTVMGEHEGFTDTGYFTVYAGLKLEKLEEGIRVIKQELERMTKEVVSEEELKKAKEMLRGRMAIRAESTNFVAQWFGLNYVLQGETKTLDEYLEKIDEVTALDVKKVAQELFKSQNYNLQIIGPFKSSSKFEKILSE